MAEDIEKFIPIKKAALYLVDRDALLRVDSLYCFIQRFSEQLEIDQEHEIEDENESEEFEEEEYEYEEVYVSGFLRIDEDCIADFFDCRLSGETFKPMLSIVDGTVNGKMVADEDLIFKSVVNVDEVYVKQSDLDHVGLIYGIQRRASFNDIYLVTVDQIKSEYNPEDYQVFYPDEEDEFNELYKSEEIKVTQPTRPVKATREDYAIRREQVLGAALSCLANWREKCVNQGDKIEGRKIQELIEEKSTLFWPTTGEPSMVPEGMERLINKWIKRYGQD